MILFLNVDEISLKSTKFYLQLLFVAILDLYLLNNKVMLVLSNTKMC